MVTDIHKAHTEAVCDVTVRVLVSSAGAHSSSCVLKAPHQSWPTGFVGRVFYSS